MIKLSKKLGSIQQDVKRDTGRQKLDGRKKPMIITNDITIINTSLLKQSMKAPSRITLLTQHGNEQKITPI